MRVLITGGGGNLGRVLAPTVEEAGHEPVLMDNRNLETPYRSVRGDVRDGAEVLEALRGYDVVVHAAALHGIHLDKRRCECPFPSGPLEAGDCQLLFSPAFFVPAAVRGRPLMWAETRS